jgi:NPCBM/NEW2 domain-containing protein
MTLLSTVTLQAATEGQFLLKPLKGPTVEGRSILPLGTSNGPTQNGSIELETAEGVQKFPIDQILQLTRKQFSPSKIPLDPIEIKMIDGSRFLATGFSIAGGQLNCIRTTGPSLFPLQTVRSIRLEKAPILLYKQWLALVRESKICSDRIVVQKSDSLRSHQGIIEQVDSKQIDFVVNSKKMPLLRDRVFGLIFSSTNDQHLKTPACQITELDGSTWTVAKWTAHAIRLEATLSCGPTVTIPIESIGQIDFSRGKIVYLDSLKPTSFKWTPYFGFDEKSSDPEFQKMRQRWFAPKPTEQSTPKIICIGGKTFDKGLSLHSRTKIDYQLTEPYSRLRATGAIADQVRPNGQIRLTIKADDRPVWNKNYSGTDKPEAIDLDINGSKQISILVDFGPDGDQNDHFNLGDIRLVK